MQRVKQIICLVLLAAARPALALYEDQAGKLDWYRQQIGVAKHALFHSTGQQRLALVATEPGVLAGVDLRNGQIAWRQVLPDGEAITSISQHGKGLLSVSVAPAGAYVRLWGPMGGLMWDAHMPLKQTAGVESPAPAVAVSGSSIVVGWQSSMRAFHGGTGELLWEDEREGGQLAALVQRAAAEAEGMSTAASTTTSAGTPPSPPLHAYTVSDATGNLELAVYEASGKGSRAGLVAGSTSVLAASGTKPAGAVGVLTLDGAQLAFVDVSGTKLLVHEVGTSARLEALELPSLPAGATATLEPTRLPRMVLLRLSTGGSLLLELPSPKSRSAGKVLTLVRAEEGPAGRHVYATTASKEGKAVLALATLRGAALGFETLELEADGAKAEWAPSEALPYDEEAYGPLASAWLNSYVKKEGGFGHRLLLSTAEHSLQLIQAGKDAKVGWVRAEALASVVRAEPVPLPALIAEGASDGGEGRPSFAFVLPTLLESLKQKVEFLSGGLAAFAAEPTGPPPAHADAYGFRQAMIAATAAGKLFALHTSDGSVLWSRRVPPVAEGEAPPQLPFLLVCRGGAHPQAVVVAQGADAWAVHALSPTSGKVLAGSAPSGAGKVLHATRLHQLAAPDGSTRPPVLLLDDGLKVHLYPDTEEVRQGVTRLLGDLFFYLHEPSTGGLTGYAVAKAAGGGFKAVRRWALALPKEGPGVKVRLGTFPQEAAVHSPVRVLGDRSVLHKYVNRNLLAVGIEQPGDGDFEDASLLLMLVDTVSGRVVHSANHPGMRGPLTLLLGENWLTYHFWNPKGLTYHMAVVELFTNSTFADDPVSLMLGGAPDYAVRENGFDAFSRQPPHALSQSYAFSAPVEALAVTQTIQGITPKFVLVGTTAGQLVLLDKRFLDPRRPVVPGGPAKMSAADKEEGLVPYGPSLGGISPLTVVSHKHTLARPRAITASPTNLESTSLAFVMGLDLFMARVAPVRSFDLLNEDFNYVALVGAIIGLTVGTYASGYLSDRKDLKRAWK